MRITTHAGTEVEGRGSGSFALDLSIYFHEGGGCTTSSYGEPCPSSLQADIAKKGGEQQVKLKLEGAAKNAPGAVVLGTAGLDLPLGSCRLLVDPLVLVPLTTKGNGSAQLVFQVAAGIPFAWRAQGVLLSSGVLSASNAVRLGCGS